MGTGTLDRVNRVSRTQSPGRGRAEPNAAQTDRAMANGRLPPHLLAVSRGGPLFTRLVLSNYRQENITASDVADLVSVKLKHLPKIEDEVRIRSALTVGGLLSLDQGLPRLRLLRCRTSLERLVRAHYGCAYGLRWRQ